MLAPLSFPTVCGPSLGNSREVCELKPPRKESFPTLSIEVPLALLKSE